MVASAIFATRPAAEQTTFTLHPAGYLDHKLLRRGLLFVPPASPLGDFGQESRYADEVSSMLNIAAKELSDDPRRKTAIIRELGKRITASLQTPEADPGSSEEDDSSGPRTE